MTTTLLQLRNMCKQRSDMSGSTSSDQFIPDDEWNGYINSSFAEFHDIVVRNDVRFYLTSSIFVVSNNTSLVTLPTDFMTANGMERALDSTLLSWYDVAKFQWRERNAGNNSLWALTPAALVRYNIVGNSIMLTPPANVAGTYRLWYYPIAPVLVNDADTFDDQRYWYEYVVVDASIKAMQKQEDDVSVLMNQKQALKARVELMGSDRDFAWPEQAGVRGNGNGSGGGYGPGGYGYGY